MFEVICKNPECKIVDFVNKFVNDPNPVICGSCGLNPEVQETNEVWIEPTRGEIG
jgi:hypothetical protein